MNYANIKYFDIANGPGVRVSLYVSGCRNKCKSCFNPETWDFNYGKPFTVEEENSIIKGMTPDYIKGFTLLGGDPFEPENQVALIPFLQRLKKQFPKKSIWAFTGYNLDSELLAGKKGGSENVLKMLECIDVLVDGRFVDELADKNLKFRGSSNQRVIVIKPTLEKDEVILWDEQTVI